MFDELSKTNILTDKEHPYYKEYQEALNKALVKTILSRT